MNPQEIFLSDYKKPEFKVINIDLCFNLDPEKTIVSSEIKFKCIKNNPNIDSSLILDGKNLKLISLAIDGIKLDKNSYKLREDKLEILSSKITNSEFK